MSSEEEKEEPEAPPADEVELDADGRSMASPLTASSASTGRRLSKDVWDHVSCVKQQDGKYLQTCKFCDMTKKSKQPQSTIWGLHFVSQCKKCGVAVRLVVFTNTTSDQVKDAGKKRNIGSDKSAAAFMSSGLQNVTKKQKTMEAYGDKCDDARAATINMKIMEFVTGCAVAMLVVESTYFIGMLMALNSVYVKRYLPKADAFTRTWLPKLYNSIKESLKSKWSADRDLYVNLGFDGFKGEDAKKVYILTGSKLDKIAFLDCVEESEERQTKEVVAEMCVAQMILTAGGVDNVEDTHASVCGDNTSVNPAAGAIIERRFPKVFWNGCRSHCGDLLCEDVSKLTEIDELVRDVKEVVKFVRHHEKVKRAYVRLATVGRGTILVSFPDTRFAYTDKMFEALLGPQDRNIEVFSALLAEPEWHGTLTDGIAHHLLVEFGLNVSDPEWFKKIKCLRKLTQPISIFIHHLERPGARASWLLPAFEALEKDLSVWTTSTTTRLLFEQETIEAVTTAFRRRWVGEGRLVGLKAPQYVMAMLVDPTMTVPLIALPQDWNRDCMTVLERFYIGTDLLAARNELYELVNQNGEWGNDVQKIQELIEVAAKENKYHIQIVLEQQVKALTIKPHLLWKMNYQSQFPKLTEVAIRLAVMTTQSADVERVCKVHKIVHTKVRNRLKNANVVKLLYCYVNLRLLKSLEVDHAVRTDNDVLEDFLSQALLDDVDEEEADV
jgi:hypothetical protein